MNVLFWLNGSGGQRRERKIVSFEKITKENLIDNIVVIEHSLEQWKDKINCHSQIIRWGWDENFNSESLEPTSQIKN